jgi:hypothetical protein
VPNLWLSTAWYAVRGAHVFPCKRRSKHPAISGWPDAATTDVEALRALWRDPLSNVGIACGPSLLVVVDIDGEPGDASRAALEAKHGALPATWAVETARGQHLYFRHDHSAARIGNSASKIGDGIDIRGDGGFVLAPPSIHPDGHVYRWAEGCGPHQIPIAPLPDWLRELLIDRPYERSSAPISLPPAQGRERSYARAALARECSDVQNAPEGTRNARLNAAAFSIGQLVASGWLDDRLARGALIAAGLGAGLTQLESIKTANSGISAGMRSPRHALEERSAAHG